MWANFDAWAAALFTFLGIAISSLLNFLTRRDKQDSTNNQQFIQNVFTQLGMLSNRIEVLEKERDDLMKELKDVMDELNTVRQENAELRAENRIHRERIDSLLKAAGNGSQGI